MKRLVLACAIVIAAFVIAVAPRHKVRAAAQDFQITSLNCSSVPGQVQITNLNKITAPGSPSALGFLAIAFSQPGSSIIQTFPINNLIGGGGGPFSVLPGGSVNLQVGVGAVQAPATPGGTLASNQTLAITSQALLQPGTIVSLIDQNPANTVTFDSESCPLLGLSRTLTVSTLGFDLIAPTQPNTSCGPDLAGGNIPTQVLPGPCFTIANALAFARDGDTIIVESGIYEVCTTMEVSKIVTITAGSNVTAGNAKTILHSFSGQTVFHVTTIGAAVGPSGQSTHAALNGLTIGGAFRPGQAAILLDGDAYTDVTNNVLGGEQLNNPNFTGEPCPPTQQPLPPGFGFTTPAFTTKQEVFGNAASIILQNSDHPNISNNSILGSSIFKFAPLLTPGDSSTGFGIVTSECLGLAPDASDSVTIGSNLIDRNVNAGIWLCSDGGGFHQIKNNFIRNNGRGILLRAIADSTLDNNTVSNEYQDGIIIYDAANNNTISNNTVESHRTSGAAGIRVGGFGASLFPLQTVLTNNRLLRNWSGIVIAGARNTAATGNTITAEDVRTAILLQVGATGSPIVTQPSGTVFHQNQIVANGTCGAQQGCAVRLDSFVTVTSDFTQNNFGLPGDADLNTVLWHKPNDPALGYINAGQGVGPGPSSGNNGSSQTPTPGASQTFTPCVSPNFPPGCTTTPGTGGNNGSGNGGNNGVGNPCIVPGFPTGCVPTPTPTRTVQ